MDTMTIQLFAPGSDPLTASPTSTMTLAPNSAIATPFLHNGAGTWYAVITSALKSKVYPTLGVASEYFSVELGSYTC